MASTTTRTITVRVGLDVAAALEELANAEGVGPSTMAARALSAGLVALGGAPRRLDTLPELVGRLEAVAARLEATASPGPEAAPERRALPDRRAVDAPRPDTVPRRARERAARGFPSEG